ncbi:hypothetical protein, partial [Xanthomonas fragariae]|uniref:hypothetical protein n=1 Tax=Xanthomonas fragariae TaxID=48664 RepID=UPI001F1AC014
QTALPPAAAWMMQLAAALFDPTILAKQSSGAQKALPYQSAVSGSSCCRRATVRSSVITPSFKTKNGGSRESRRSLALRKTQQPGR